MTCWPLRNSLLPLLWTDVEGCVSHTRYYYGTNTGSSGSNLYAQCVYLTLNPVVATHVRCVQSPLIRPGSQAAAL